MSLTKGEMQKKLQHELRLYFVYFTYLFLFFTSMTAYQSVILDKYALSFVHYGYVVVQAMLLAKIIIIGELFGLGDRYRNQPLIIVTLYKTMIFTIFTLGFSILEHFIVGFAHGATFKVIYLEFLNTGLDDVLAKLFVVMTAFIPFFAFIETNRALGDDKLIKLFFRR